MRAAVVLASCALVLSGCSGSDSPDASSQDEFCEQFNQLVDDVMGSGIDDSEGMVEAIKDWAADMEDVGPPEEMPDDAQRGFDVFLDHAADLDAGMGIEDLQRLGDDLSDEDRADGEAFTTWVRDSCPVG